MNTLAHEPHQHPERRLRPHRPLRLQPVRRQHRIPNYDIGSLGFNPNFVSDYEAAGNSGFPTVFVEGYGDNENLADGLFGSWGHDEVVWKSSEVGGVYSKFVGSHTLKAGLQWRQIGVDSIPNTYGAAFYFDPGFTQGPSATSPVAGSGDAFAAFLLGLPNGDSNFTNAAPANVFINYYGGFVQDDWRVNENLVVNLGLRLEHENGLAEEEDRFIVGWAYDDPFPVQVPGLNLTGGLQYAGTGGKTTQSDPKGLKLGPRAGFVYSLNDKTVVRGGYGIFWAPNQYPGPGQNTFATRGYTAYHQRGSEQRRRSDSRLGEALESLPQRRRTARGEQPGSSHRRRRDDALQRPIREVALHAAVVHRHPARSRQRSRVQDRVPGKQGHRPLDRRHQRQRGQHQPARGPVPLAGLRPERPRSEPVLRKSRRSGLSRPPRRLPGASSSGPIRNTATSGPGTSAREPRPTTPCASSSRRNSGSGAPG